MKAWHRRHAIQIVAALPDETDDALIVLDLARQFVQNFLGPSHPVDLDLDRERGVVIALSSASNGSSR